MCRFVLTCGMPNTYTGGVLGGIEGSIEVVNTREGPQKRFYSALRHGGHWNE